MKQPQQRDEFIRKRIERQKKIKKRRLVIALFFTIILLIMVGVTLSLTVFFPIEEISVYGSKIYSAEQIVASSGIDLGENLFTVMQNDVEATLRKSLPYIESVKLSRKLPGRINITVTDAKEFACYSVKNKYYVVSKSGYVLNTYDSVPQGLFEIKTDNVECKVGSQIKFKDEKTSKIVENLIDYFSADSIKINYIDVNDALSITAMVEDRFSVSFGTSNSLENKVKHLKGMIDKIQLSKTGKINLSMWTQSKSEGTFIEGKLE